MNPYSVSVSNMAPRPIAVVRTRMPVAQVPRLFAGLLGKVYDAAKNGAIVLDGQNIFVYRGGQHGDADVEFGVGTRQSFAPIGAVVYSETPGGEVATTTHWGEYSGLGGAHEAVVTWCSEHRRPIAGPRWEVYGHWSDDPTSRRTDVYYLLCGPSGA